MSFYFQSGENKILYEKYFKNYSLSGQKYYFEMAQWMVYVIVIQNFLKTH